MAGRKHNKITARKKGINLGMLEDLYNQRIKVAEAEEKKYRGIVKYFVEDVIVDQMMKTSPDMADLYRETYWGGSFYDGLKVPSYRHFNSRQGKIFSRLDPPTKSLISTFSSNGRQVTALSSGRIRGRKTSLGFR